MKGEGRREKEGRGEVGMPDVVLAFHIASGTNKHERRRQGVDAEGRRYREGRRRKEGGGERAKERSKRDRRDIMTVLE